MKDKTDLRKWIFLLLFLVGVLVFFYPSVSNTWNSYHQTKVMSIYEEESDRLNEEASMRILKSAREYNESVAQTGIQWNVSKSQKKKYKEVLNINDSGVMGMLDIPVIDCSLPVYHGTDDAVLQVGAGHVEGSSLPVGGESSHCILSGHRGLPSATLFTNLNRLEEGDWFRFRILDQEIHYVVHRIEVVLPTEVESLKIEEGKDYCTLVTCTPYGVNSHRLLVTGRRMTEEETKDLGMEKEENEVRTASGKRFVLVIGGIVLAIFCLVCFFVPAKAFAERQENYSIRIHTDYKDAIFSLYKLDIDGKEEEKPIRKGKVGMGGTLKWRGVERGRYVLVSTSVSTDQGEYISQPYIVQIPTRLEDGELLYSLNIYPKFEPVNEEKADQDTGIGEMLPQTGQPWGLFWLLILFGMASFTIAFVLKIFSDKLQ